MDSAAKALGRCSVRLKAISVLLLVSGNGACASYVRVPLAVPLPSVGGAHPATPQGLDLFLDFGDGVWGQEQDRAEIVGGGIGLALANRVEISGSGHQSTRSVRDQNGNEERGETTGSIRGKVRFADFARGGGSVGISIAHLTATRVDGDAQNEHLAAWDVAVPVEYYPLRPGGVTDLRWSVYAGPRLVFQSFDDRLVDVTSTGTLAAALLGTAARWRYFAILGELNVAHTSPLDASAAARSGDWLVLPSVSVRGMIPIG